MRGLFRNCLSVKEENGWYMPIRFTESQMSVYAKSEPTTIRSLASTSVCLAFRSAAKKLTLEYRIGPRARDWAVFDVVCDGVLFASLPIDNNEGIIELELSGDESVLTHVYLPHLVNVSIRNVSADAELIPVVENDKLWLALGDSITQGMVAHRPSCTYPTLISEIFGCELINAGVGGICFNSNELDYIGKEPSLITIALGCNDWGVEADAFRANVSAYLDKLVSIYKCKNIYLLLPIWRSDADGEKASMTFKQHRELIKIEALRYPEIKIIDAYGFVPHMKDYYGDPGDRMVHPNDEGFLRYALSLIKKINNNGEEK